jgi:hypothetical protein
VDPDFPLHLWDHLLPQAEMTLNLLQKSRQHPQLSTAAHYNIMVDYNKTYFAPPGYKIIAHENPSQLGHPTANMATLWGPPCTIIGVKMFTSHPLPAKG